MLFWGSKSCYNQAGGAVPGSLFPLVPGSVVHQTASCQPHDCQSAWGCVSACVWSKKIYGFVWAQITISPERWWKLFPKADLPVQGELPSMSVLAEHLEQLEHGHWAYPRRLDPNLMMRSMTSPGRQRVAMASQALDVFLEVFFHNVGWPWPDPQAFTHKQQHCRACGRRMRTWQHEVQWVLVHGACAHGMHWCKSCVRVSGTFNRSPMHMYPICFEFLLPVLQLHADRICGLSCELTLWSL